MTENDHERRIAKLEAKVSLIWAIFTLVGSILAGLSGKVIEWVTQGW